MFIVIEGSDGSGKATQTEILTENLKKKGFPVQRLSFPDYANPSSALVRSYLAGEFGSDPMAINPYLSALFYSVDRGISAVKWKEKALADNWFTVSDRYVGSNAIHQAAKLEMQDEKVEFFKWLADTEFGKLALPVPDLTIYLNMPAEASQKLMKGRALKNKAGKDIHEEDVAFMQKSCETGLLAANFFGWTIINCVGKSISEVSKDVMKVVKKAGAAV